MRDDALGARIGVLRVYHAGRDPQHRGRERALSAAGVDVTLVVPAEWPEAGTELSLSPEPFRVVALPVRRGGDVNRHVYLDSLALERVINETRPDVIDIHEEPISIAAHQWLRAAPANVPVLMYTAQNIDKRFPPPFCRYERAAYQRVTTFYPCSRQAAAVLRGKGVARRIEVLPLGYDDALFSPGSQSLDADEIVLMLVGRLVAEKGVDDAIQTLARVHAVRPARLVVSGEGPAEAMARRLAVALGVADRVEFRGWQDGPDLAAAYQAAHVVLVPSHSTAKWVEQFGRVIVEAQACGAVVAGYASGAIPEVAGEAGVVVRTGDVEQLADSVVQLVGDSDELERLRDRGQRQAATRTWQAVAARQASLYWRVHTEPSQSTDLPKSPRRRRGVAFAEFGPTADTDAGVRPFALPILRQGGPVPRVLAGVLDVATEVASGLSR
jgi:glycosyltransferase involved in cell wall biosynthesis